MHGIRLLLLLLHLPHHSPRRIPTRRMPRSHHGPSHWHHCPVALDLRLQMRLFGALPVIRTTCCSFPCTRPLQLPRRPMKWDLPLRGPHTLAGGGVPWRQMPQHVGA